MSWLGQVVKRKRKPSWMSFWDSDGLHAEDEDDSRIDIPWKQVREVHAYKVDLYAYDQIRVRFSRSEDSIEISEEQAAFGGLFRAMEENLGISADWYSEMMRSPAFKLNPTCLYSEGNALVTNNGEDSTEK